MRIKKPFITNNMPEISFGALNVALRSPTQRRAAVDGNVRCAAMVLVHLVGHGLEAADEGARAISIEPQRGIESAVSDAPRKRLVSRQPECIGDAVFGDQAPSVHCIHPCF